MVTELRQTRRQKPVRAGDDHEKMQILREDLYPAGKCPALAGLLPGVQSQIQAGGKTDREMPQVREDIHLPVRRTALAPVLSGVSGKAEAGTQIVCAGNGPKAVRSVRRDGNGKEERLQKIRFAGGIRMRQR